jgi:hypothetical protein
MAATNPDSVGNQPFHARAPTEHNKPIAEQINSGPRDQPLDPHAVRFVHRHPIPIAVSLTVPIPFPIPLFDPPFD